MSLTTGNHLMIGQLRQFKPWVLNKKEKHLSK